MLLSVTCLLPTLLVVVVSYFSMLPTCRRPCSVWSAWSVLSVVLLCVVLCSQCSVFSYGARVSQLTVYSDAGCAKVWTNASATWSVFNSLNDSQVDNSLLGPPRACLGAISPTIQSARVACATSYSTSNVTLYTLSAVEWTHNSTCPTSYPFDIRYYFYGRARTCIRSVSTRSKRSTPHHTHPRQVADKGASLCRAMLCCAMLCRLMCGSGVVTMGGATQEMFAEFSCLKDEDKVLAMDNGGERRSGETTGRLQMIR